jgi:anti-sigma B factor antagonist
MTFSISITEAGAIRLSIEGELDAVTVADLRVEIEKLLMRQLGRIEVDLSQLRMLDSSGVGALVSLYKQARARGGEVVVLGLRDQPLAIFRLLRLDRVMVGTELKAPPAATTQKHPSSGS